MRLKNWSVTVKNRFSAPEIVQYHLQGNVYGHQMFNDGTPVITSMIVKVNDKCDYKEVITRSGSIYELHREDVDKEAEEQFPNYYDRLKLIEV